MAMLAALLDAAFGRITDVLCPDFEQLFLIAWPDGGGGRDLRSGRARRAVRCRVGAS